MRNVSGSINDLANRYVRTGVRIMIVIYAKNSPERIFTTVIIPTGLNVYVSYVSNCKHRKIRFWNK